MRNNILLLFFSFVSALSFVLPVVAEDGWLVRQKAKGLGALTILIYPKGLRVAKADPEYTIICKAPDFNVVVFSRQTKSYFTSPLAKFDGMHNVNLEDFSRLSVNKVGKDSKFGVEGTKHSASVSATASPEFKQMQPILFTYTDLSGIQRPVIDALCKLYGVPAKGFPLECSFACPDSYDKRKVYRYRTLSLDKVSMNNNDLEMPKGLTKVGTVDKVIMKGILID